MTRFWMLAGCVWCASVIGLYAAEKTAAPVAVKPFADVVEADRPVLWWRFESDKPEEGLQARSLAEPALVLTGKSEEAVGFGSEGPRPEAYPGFPATNRALKLDGSKSSSLRYTDPGDHSPLDFDNGDAITLEAWVNITKLANGQQMYVVGKGRTRNPGVKADNQNYALRLSGDKGGAALSFLFRDREPHAESTQDFHRWNSTEVFAIDSGWHHIAVSYVFGQPESIAGYIDGQPVPGKWDYGGPTTEAPVVDNDELWIGSSMGNNPASTFLGQIDEIAIHRKVVTAEQMQARFAFVEPPSYQSPEKLPEQTVLLEIFEGLPDKLSWKFRLPEPAESLNWPGFVLTELPQKYSQHGVRDDRSNPLMVRMLGMVTWPAGEIRLRLRARSAAKLRIDGVDVAELNFPKQLGDGSDGNGSVYPIPGDDPTALRDVQPGDQETVVTFKATGQPQRVQLDLFAGGNKRRTEFGEAALAWNPVDALEPEQIVLFADPVRLSNAGWLSLAEQLHQQLIEQNQQRRTVAAHDWAAYWERRHQQAREILSHRAPITIPELPLGYTAQNDIDYFIAATLATEQVAALPVVDDWAFLRRATLDLIGITPTPEMIAEYFDDAPEHRRFRLIDRLLQHPGWADHWMGYWQDVLAENPNIINPTLNNTGPFRWWLHESFSDNKPFDRFATELILMEGSSRFGGPAGFAVASQNDSPMAAKAHILSQAFLGMEMKCARCHDAPYHDFEQKDLFSIASMLNRTPVSVPKSSTIPGDPAALQSLLVKVTLKPGEPVPAEWPFAEHFSGELAEDVLLNPSDRREQLAAIITSPNNSRFGHVLVNRVWKRFLGRGISEPVDDWESFAPSHPELLVFLERRFIESGYDLKALTRLIMNSQLYQREVDAEAAVDDRRARLFAGPSPRRLSAEQVVDSMFTISGKPVNVECVNIDVDGMRSYEQSINLGVVRRAWQLSSMSNERDRPSLSLPGAQTLVDVLETFGWRSSRPDPVTTRSQEITVLQPAIVANGVIGKRTTQLSDDSRFTALALREQPLEEFITQVFEVVLTRPPEPRELQVFKELLEEGYDQRRRPDAPIVRTRTVTSLGVAWTNHLIPEANDRKIALKHDLDKGDPPTQRLTPEWRERAEDFVWTLLNSPEFVFVP